MINFLEATYNTISSAQFLLAAIIVSLSVKIYFLSILIPQGLRAIKIQKSWIYLLGILAGSMFGDIAWIVKLVREIWLPEVGYGLTIFCIRMAWAFFIVQYQSLALFIEGLTEKNFKLNRFHKIMVALGGSFSLYFFYLAFFDSTLIDQAEREQAKQLTSNMPLEILIMRYANYYLFNLLLFPSLYVALKKIRSADLPLILKKQLRIFIQFLICPYIMVEFLSAATFLFKSFEAYLYPTVSVSTFLLVYAIYYCIQRVIGLRFLNFASQVQSHYKVNFIDDFKNVLEQLSDTTSVQELNRIIQTFFKGAFHIPLRKSNIYIRKSNQEQKNDPKNQELQRIEVIVDNFLTSNSSDIIEFIHKQKVIIFDEIAFTNFYDEDKTKNNILQFLENINADIFLPIYEKQKIVAYIIVDRHARPYEFYSNVEHDEMVVFASYLGNILNFIKNRNVETLMQQEKELRDELYNFQQEMNQYKESIRSFLRNSKQKEIGIIFYKNRRFIFANQTAKELIKININTQEGHPITQALRTIARQVEEYKAPQTSIIKDHAQAKLVISGVPNLENNNVIITVYYPEITDIITKQIVSLKDPTKWDYLLYLETTQAGQLINQLLPGSGEILLHFKINLLKTALSKKAILLEIPHEDEQSVIDLLHHISKRETLHTLNLQSPEKNGEIAHRLFGTSQNFSSSNSSSPCLFKKLDTNGTLFIKNIEFLDIETQEYLAEYIETGYYRLYKSDQKLISNVRVICSTHQNVQSLTHDETFSVALYNALQKTSLTFPSLISLPDQELQELIYGFTEQAIKSQTFKNMLELTEQEIAKILFKRPASLVELKNRIQQSLIVKSKKNQIFHETQFDPAYTISDPELIEAARLGKHALRDSKIMALLWNKFKNQNQIATFLGVNRSSVNRRCKDYNLA